MTTVSKDQREERNNVADMYVSNVCPSLHAVHKVNATNKRLCKFSLRLMRRKVVIKGKGIEDKE